MKSKKRGRSSPAKTNPVPLVQGAGARHNEVHTDNETTDSTKPTHQQHRATQEQRAKRRRNKARRMRTVSSNDQLTVRGANSRTGLVSPFILTDASSSGHESSVDYINIPHPNSGRVGRTCSGKWKQDGQGWSLVESPLLSPIAQSTNGTIREPSRQVSARKLGDKLLQHMPGVDDPEPINMKDWEVRKFQEDLADLRRREGSDAMVDPDTLPSPRVRTPEGPSSPPNRARKIARKMVGGGGMPGGIGSVTGGSGPTPKDASTDTVVRNEQKRASSVPTPRKEVREQHRVRIVTPSNTPKESSLETRADETSKTGTENPFLGSRQPAFGETANATHSPFSQITRLREPQRRLSSLTRQQEEARCRYAQNAQQEEAHHSQSPQPTLEEERHCRYPQTTRQEEAYRCPSLPTEQSPSKESPVDPQATLTLNQYLPRLPHFLPPSHFANLEAPTHCRPGQLLPARLRPLEQQRKAVEDACTSTSISITTSRPRPKVQRQDESRDVRRANHHSPEQEVRKENCLQPDIQRDRQPSCTKPMAENQDMTPRRTRHIPHPKQVDRQEAVAEARHQKTPGPGQLDRQPDVVGARHQKKVPISSRQHPMRYASPGAERAARVAVLGDIHNQQFKEIQVRKRASPIQGLGPGSTDTIRDNVQEKSYGAGCARIYDHHGSDKDQAYSEWGFLGIAEDELRAQVRPIAPTEFAVRSDGSAWFAGQWAEVDEHGDHLGNFIAKRDGALVRRRSTLKKAADVKQWLYAAEDYLHMSAKLSYVHWQLVMMLRHVFRTFHHSSPVLMVLRSPKARTQDYLIAAKDAALALFYLIVLLNVFMALRKVVMLVAMVLYWVWHPVDTVAVILRWCVMT